MKPKHVPNLLNGSCAHPADTRPQHIESYEIFKEWANGAFSGVFPKSASPRYSSAYVLLLYWSEDDLGVASEATCLQRVFEDQYNFETETYLIPNIDSEQLLVQRIFEFRKEHAAPENLLIIYYGGHAEQAEHDHCVWRSNLNNHDAQVDWNMVQPFILSTDADCLILLDCCYAAKGAKDSGTILKGTNEIIAACSPESTTTGVERRSFTSVLVRQLEEFAYAFRKLGKQFTAVGLHSALFRLSRELQYGPFYVRLTSSEYSSIDLTPLPNTKLPGDDDSGIHMSLSTEGGNVSESSSLSSTSPAIAKVLVAVHLSRSPSGDLVGFLRGEGLIPEYVVGMELLKVEAVFESNSTLVILSMPISAWDLLPEDAPCSYVGITYSENLLAPSMSRQLVFELSPHRDENAALSSDHRAERDRRFEAKATSSVRIGAPSPRPKGRLIPALKSGKKRIAVESPGTQTFIERDHRQRTPLHWAAELGQVERLNSLLGNGAEILATDNKGATPLHEAASCGQRECTSALLDRLGKIGFGSVAQALVMRDKSGRTPIDCAKGIDLEEILFDLYSTRKNIDIGKGRSSPHWDFGGRDDADEVGEQQTQDIWRYEGDLRACVLDTRRKLKTRLTPILQHFLVLDKTERGVAILALIRGSSLRDERLYAQMLNRLSRGHSQFLGSELARLVCDFQEPADSDEEVASARNEIPTRSRTVDAARYFEFTKPKARIPISNQWWDCCNCQNSNNPALAPGRCTICNHARCPSCRRRVDWLE